MTFESQSIPAVKLIRPKRFGDHRGYFTESYNRARLAEAGLTAEFVQDNESLSAEAGTVRGLHFQTPPHAQAKLVRCVVGRILDVAVDIRQGSPTYGQFVTAELTAEGGEQLFVPVGFAHGFETLEPGCLVQYKVTDKYAPDCDAGVIWNDPELGIPWRTDATAATLSEKDAALPRFADFESPFEYEGDDA